MNPSWQDLLDELIATQIFKYRDDKEREYVTKEIMMHVLKATLEKLRDQDAT